MILISHRGNINGPNLLRENSPYYIIEAINKGYDAEIDIWIVNDIFYLGHDKPQYIISIDWITERKDKLWIHCKNIKAIEWFNITVNMYNYFWHQDDNVTLTSKNFIWAYPGKQPIENSIAVLPELNDDNISKCLGICSDYIETYTKL